MSTFTSEASLARAALCLGARRVPGWSDDEERLALLATSSHPTDAAALPAQVRAGEDPLGDALCRLRSPACRRRTGQTFTPWVVVHAMLAWAGSRLTPVRVVEPGMGSARFLVTAGLRWPTARLVGVETDPLAAMVGRATLAAAGMAGRAEVHLADYRTVDLPKADGPTLFAGNPPYVRHHQVPTQWKEWLRTESAARDLRASTLAGLHVHFFLATARHAAPGDAGVLVTSAEWLDVNYGDLVRGLLLGPLGGEAIHVVDARQPVFADAMTTAAITCFRPGTRPPSVGLRLHPGSSSLGDLGDSTPVPREVLNDSTRWRSLATAPGGLSGSTGLAVRAHRRGVPAGHVELGELCRVHRGQVTGANRTWLTPAGASGLPDRYVFPSVTRARELFEAGESLRRLADLRCVIDLPADLDELSPDERELVAAFLGRARAAGVADGYIARHRDPWWRVRLRPPAPILATYMARRPPAFVRNAAGARHVNIAHGLYPRDPMSPGALDALAAFLRSSVTLSQGRAYAGGLTKFEPREMERLPVPGPGLLPEVPEAASDPRAEPHPGQP